MPATMAKSAVTVQLDPGKRAELELLAQATQRDPSALISEAIDAYLVLHRRQSAHVQEAIRQADAGEFASPEEVAAVYSAWK